MPVSGRYLSLLSATAKGFSAGNGDRYTTISVTSTESNVALKANASELKMCTTNPSLYNDLKPSATCPGVGNKCLVPCDEITQYIIKSRIHTPIMIIR